MLLVGEELDVAAALLAAPLLLLQVLEDPVQHLLQLHLQATTTASQPRLALHSWIVTSPLREKAMTHVSADTTIRHIGPVSVLVARSVV